MLSRSLLRILIFCHHDYFFHYFFHYYQNDCAIMCHIKFGKFHCKLQGQMMSYRHEENSLDSPEQDPAERCSLSSREALWVCYLLCGHTPLPVQPPIPQFWPLIPASCGNRVLKAFPSTLGAADFPGEIAYKLKEPPVSEAGFFRFRGQLLKFNLFAV